jgi:hypothetical protein
MESSEACLPFRIIGGEIHEHADTPDTLVLLRARRERPCSCGAAEQRDELAAPHGVPFLTPGPTLPHRCVRSQLCITAKLSVQVMCPAYLRGAHDLALM